MPLFVYAHSIGASLVASLLIRNPYLNIAGVIFGAGLFKIHKSRKIGWRKRLFLNYFAEQFDELILNALINPTALTSNNFEIKKLFDDRLCSPIIG